ncbi:hypothetical protein CC78DRAFT_532952 [Lojkania enalia]|uniref:Peroxin 11C n=1 Tax=Lojkania enalia TaxID=147567 RepID=A0A9P4KA27_9PLEO|nr:hypothetical protein CC78DRAFT_532952 [Didymosphaeria enalia]
MPPDPAIEPPTSTPSAPPNPQPSSNNLRNFRLHVLKILSRILAKTDITLLRLSHFFSSPTSTDALLCTLSYTLELLHALFSRLLTRYLTTLATSLATKADAFLLPGESLIATLPTPKSTKWLAQAVRSTKSLAETIGDFRIFVRLWGLAGLYTWARSTYAAPLARDARTGDRVVRGVVWAQIASCVLFQVLENGAYLSSKGVLTGEAWAGEAGKVRETRWWVWSSRFWAAHVGLEFVRLWALWRLNRKREGEEEKEKDGEKEGKLIREQRKREDWVWWRDLVSNVAYFPMTLHWSVEEGILSDLGVGALGAVAGGALLVDAWKQTA